MVAHPILNSSHFYSSFFSSGGALAVGVAYFSYCVVLLIFIFAKKLHKETWYGK